MSESTVIFCLVPHALAEHVPALREHYADDPAVRVLIERRIHERRRGRDPDAPPLPPRGHTEDRRAGSDRRRPVLARAPRPLPRSLGDLGGELRFVQRLMPVGPGLESLDTDEVVARVRLGDAEAPTELYWRCYERIHSRLAVLLGDARAADRSVGAAFGRVLDAVDAGAAPDRFEDLLYAAVDQGVVPIAADRTAATDRADLTGTLSVVGEQFEEPVQVHDRDPRWFTRAQMERDALLRRGGEHLVAIEHVGGTAVPAVPGRPIVDLLLAVDALPVPEPLHELLVARGYEALGEAGTPERAYYRQRGAGHYDVHVVAYGSALWRDAIALREHLRMNPAEAQRWAAVRREAATASPGSSQRYLERRASTLAELLDRAHEAAVVEYSQRAA